MKLISLALILVLLVIAAPVSAQDLGDVALDGSESGRAIRDFDGILEFRESDSTGDTYLLHENHGGNWCDAEKVPGDDGPGNPPPVNPGEEDDEMCWAGAASNVLEWTGWGMVVHATAGDITNTDEIFQHFQDHWVDTGGYEDWGWEWWLNGTTPGGTIDVPGGGNFWPSYTWTDYFHEEWNQAQTMQAIDTYAHNGWGMTLGFPTHAVTCWGFDYDPDVDKNTNPEDYYLGVWLTDPDDNKWDVPAPDMLRYYEVDYDSVNNRWYLPLYQGGWYIESIFALEPFPNTPPVADANGPYSADEGSSVMFDGSGSSDPDGNPLQYRWDFDNDGNWDTGWSSDPSATYAYPDDYNDVAVLEVSDYVASDTDTAAVTITNVAPVITVVGDTIDENGTATVSGTITDPSSLDTFTVVIDWGEGAPESYSYPVGATTYGATHQYLDDNPTGTPSDDYPVSVAVTDDDGGVGTGSTTVTVNNVNPVVTGITMDQPNGQFVLPTVHELDFTGTFTDVGTQDTHTAVWDWGDMSSSVGVVSESGGSGTVTGSHMYSAPGDYTVTLTVTDDDTGSDSNTYLVHVRDVDEALTITNDYIQGLDDSYFKGKADQRRSAIANMFNALADMWADGEYNGMIQELRNNLREKADGYVDGKANNDWITDSAAQGEICQKIDDITAYLDYLLSVMP